ncbi:MAG TPA: GntR family transcriptional regulator [Candidatus Dormibacteraeota bacterium]|jgi:DNA-binding GntR family transcriptional regulator
MTAPARTARERRPASRRPTSNIETYRELREAITGGRFQPNERLVESDLMAMFRAGRGAVRSALVRLDQEGLVTWEPNRGARVRLISGREAIEIEQVRIALEKMLARRAAARVTPADLDDLVATVGEMRRRVDEGDPLGYSELNARFHRRIWAIADHELAAALLTTMKSQSIRFQYRTILQPGRAERSLDEHAAIVAALVAHDPDASEAAMAEHLSQVVSTLERAIAAHSAQGPWWHPTAAPAGSRGTVAAP